MSDRPEYSRFLESEGKIKHVLHYFGMKENDELHYFEENHENLEYGKEFLETVSTRSLESTGTTYIDENRKRAAVLEEGKAHGHALMVEPFEEILESENPQEQLSNEIEFYLEDFEDTEDY